jgi:hypothetical protein
VSFHLTSSYTLSYILFLYLTSFSYILHLYPYLLRLTSLLFTSLVNTLHFNYIIFLHFTCFPNLLHPSLTFYVLFFHLLLPSYILTLCNLQRNPLCQLLAFQLKCSFKFCHLTSLLLTFSLRPCLTSFLT